MMCLGAGVGARTYEGEVNTTCKGGFRKLLRLLSGTNETILHVLGGGMLI